MKIDLHIHSKYSYDSFSFPEDIARTAAQKGLDGVAVTDHDTIAGWKAMRKATKKYGLLFVPGQEIKTKRGRKIIGDIVGIFLKKEIKSREPKEVIKEIKAQGGIVIIPHPFHILTPFKGHKTNKNKSFRLVTPFKGDIEDYKNLVDAIEVLNARVPLKSSDRKALNFAEKNNLAMTGGSDAHQWKDVGDAYTIAQKAKTLDDFKKAILNKKTRASGGKSPLRSLASPSLARFRIKLESNKKNRSKYDIQYSLEKIKNGLRKYSKKK